MCARGKVNGTPVPLCLTHHTHVCCFSVLNWVEKIFGVGKAGSTTRREIIARLTTFVTMSYIVAVNPAILKSAGIPAGPSMVATIATTVFRTLLMGLYANRPFAIAPYTGENAFIAFTVVRALGNSWQVALAEVFLAGVLFLLLTVFRLREWLVGATPKADGVCCRSLFHGNPTVFTLYRGDPCSCLRTGADHGLAAHAGAHDQDQV